MRLRYAFNRGYISDTYYRLTKTDVEVLTLLANGYSGTEMAQSLYVSTDAVRARINSAQQKLFARNRTQAVAIAIHLGIIQLESIEDWPEVEVNDPIPLAFTILELSNNVESLTPREKEVFNSFRVSEGDLSDGAVAQRLYISTNTLRQHLRNIYGKLNIRREGLIQLANLSHDAPQICATCNNYQIVRRK